MKGSVDYSYPLPKESLLTRYKTAFDSLRLGNSATLWGFPMSGDFAYLKFVFSRSDLLQTLIPHSPKERLFLFLDFDSLPDMDTPTFHKHLLFQIYTLIQKADCKKSKELMALIEEAPILIKTADPYVCFQQTQKILRLLFTETPIKLTLIIHDYFIEKWDEAWGRNIFRIWHIHRRHPDARMSILFLTKPFLTPGDLPPFLRPLRMAYFESVSYFPLFTKQETFFALDRYEKIYGVKFTKDIKEYIWKTVGGFSEFYAPILHLQQKHGEVNKLTDCEKLWFTNETILYYAKYLFETLPGSGKNHLVDLVVNKTTVPSHSAIHELGILPLPTIWTHHIATSQEQLRATSAKGEAMLPKNILLKEKLTGTEHLILHFLSQKTNQVVSKDTLAELVWKDNPDAYSDWALDKLMSRIRSKITSTTLLTPLITIRGKGYKLIV